MARPIKPDEIKRRLAAFELSKAKVPGGCVTIASEILKDVSPSTLSRFLLNRRIKTDRRPALSKEQCIAALKTHIARHKKVSRETFVHHNPVGTKWKTHWPTWQEFQEEAGVINDPAKILLLDIETAPNRAYVWGTWKQNINPEWIDAAGYVLCWTAKWLDSKEVIFQRLTNKNHRKLLMPMHQLLSEAHAVVHYNGQSFDIPTLNKEFLTNGITPPSPYKQVDLLLEMRSNFRFPSNKLDYICKVLELGGKLRHEGPQLWLSCMEDDKEAWERMEAYNRRDVDLLEKLYRKLLPWIKKHPNRAAMSGLEVCPSCGSDDIKRDGTYLASQLSYEQWNCRSCGVWFRGTKSLNNRREKRFALTA
jgi:ribosomal protein L37AE/L43A